MDLLIRWRPLQDADVRELGYGIRDTWDDLEDEIIYSQLDDARYDRALLRARVNMLESDRPFHRRTVVLMEEEARLSRAAWAQSMDACDQTHSEGILLRTTVMTQQSEIVELRAADQRRQTVISELLKADYRRQRQLVETLKIVKSLKAQYQHRDSKDLLRILQSPELPEEACSQKRIRTHALAERQQKGKGSMDDLSQIQSKHQQNKEAKHSRAYAARERTGNRNLATWPRTVGAGLRLQTTTTAIPTTTTTVTTTTQEPKEQIQMPSFASSVGLQATSETTAPSGRTKIREMVVV
ncbi:hypothetical protein Tco_0143928 [Tanacetum coccineum]